MTDITYTHTLTPGQIEDVSDIQDNFDDASDVVNGQLDTDNLAAAAGITDVQRASPNNAVWRPVFSVGGSWVAGPLTGGGVFVLKDTSAPSLPANAFLHSLPLWHVTAADVAVLGKATQVRIVADLTTNSVASGSTFVVGLRAVTPTGGSLSGLTNFNLGSSDVASLTFTSPAASSTHRGEGTAVVLPAAASYALTVGVPVSVASGSVTGISAQLQMRHA